MKEPRPIAWPGTLYSPSGSITGLTRMSVRNLFNLPIKSVELGVDPHNFPQKIVNTSTFAISSQFRYVSLALVGAGGAAPSKKSTVSASGSRRTRLSSAIEVGGSG